jgi:molybdopterin-guanine dinucleotide biosynthesis protein A
MGQDKALLVVDGRPMVRRVVDAALGAGAATVLVVGGDAPALSAALADSAAVLVPDEHPREGPLGGLLTALAQLDQKVVLVVSCDLVDPSSAAMAATVAALTGDDAEDADKEDADVAAPELDGRVQWMHAAWRSATARAALGERFTAGERSVRRAVLQSGLRVAKVGGVGPAGLADVDTPADLGRHQGQHPEWH